MSILQFDVSTQSYSNQHLTVRRENGEGNWVLTNNVTGMQVDQDMYRNDLAERTNLELQEANI